MKIETKFNPGDIIWNIEDGKANQYPIEKVQAEMRKNEALVIEYYLNVGTEKDYKSKIAKEKDCFRTRAELMDNL